MFKYVLKSGPIDTFYGTMTKEELLKSASSHDIYGSTIEDLLDHVNYLDSIINYINHYIVNDEQELPHTIRFFSIPVNENLEMSLCAVAKINNNGATYLFTNVKKFYEMYMN